MININKFSFYALWAIVLLFITCCSDNSKISILHTNFGEEIELQQNLIFTFNNDLAPDTLLNIWRDEQYLSISPMVEGKFKWLSKTELQFSPDRKFEPATDYTATLTKELEIYSDKSISRDSTSISFHTPYLQLSNVNIFWAKNALNPSVTEARINLNFNYAVDIYDLKSKMRLAVQDQVKDFQLNSAGDASSIDLALPETNDKYDNDLLKISITKGLKIAGTKITAKQKIDFETNIPDKGNFLILIAEAQYQDSSAYLRITTNQQLFSPQDFPKLITIAPSVGTLAIELIESGFLIKGNFKEGQTYDLKISQNLKGIFEGKLKNEFQQNVAFGPQKPNVSFVNKNGIYLTSKGSKDVAVRIINIPKVKVTLYKIYANNIQAFLRSTGSTNRYYEEEYGEGNEEDYYLNEINNYSDVVYEKIINTTNLKKSNGLSLLNLNFNDINNLSGIYAISVASVEENWLRSTKVLCISDIGLLAKHTDDEVLVFAHSILTTNPLEGVEVSLVSTNNQQMLKAKTDKDGVAKFEKVKATAPNFVVNMVTAQQNSDFTYLHFQQNFTENSRFEVGGIRNNPSGYQAYLYGDRDMYRPGETININTIVRNALWEPLADAPIKIKLIQPNGKEHSLQKGMLNKQGAFATSFSLASSVVTGTYLLEVYTGNDVLLTTRAIGIEEFMPDRIKVTTVIDKTNYLLSDKINITATALNLFGPPAANRKYEVELSLVRKELGSPDFPDYNFALNGKFQSTMDNDLRQGTTDSDGKAQEQFNLSNKLIFMGILQGKLFTTVFDESGRPVHSLKSFDVYTQNKFLGIKYSHSYVGTQEPMQIAIAAVNQVGKSIANVTAKIGVIKYDWQTVLENDYGNYHYVSQRKVLVLEQKLIKINNNYNYTFRPSLSGEYEVRVSLPGADSYVSKAFYAYGWGATNNSSFEVNKEGSVDIVMDKPKYESGDKANIIFKTPFAGKLLVTVERDKVYKYFTLQTDKKSASLALDITDEYLPNVYITATVIKPITENNIPLTVGHGFAPLMVENKNNKIPVTITAPASSRSLTKQRIEVKAGDDDDVEVTVAVVDEGILQLKNMESPDPFNFFFQKRALEVSSYDLYPKLLPEFRQSSAGGDGYNLEKRINPMSNKRVKLVSFWSGHLHTNGDGKAFFDVNIPAFSGDLRVMAVAYKNNAFGAQNVHIKVADPLILSTSLPRFLSPKDSVVVNVTISNTTKQNINGTLKLKSKGVVSLESSTSTPVNIKPNSEQQIQFMAYASESIGEAEITTELTALNEKFMEQNFINVRPASSLIKVSESGTAIAGKATTINTASELIPSSVQSQLLISKSPMVQFSNNLDDLVEYPYGCVEQTVSKAFPQLYFTDLVKSLNLNSKVSNQAANFYIQESINKLQTMQLPSGGLSYWQGGYEESWWGTVYAAHFLMEATKAGFEPSTGMQEKIYHYLQQKLSAKATETYYYEDDANHSLTKKIAAKEIFYTLYVLASASRQDVAMMNYYKSNLKLLSLDSRYLLAATYKIVGDNNSYRNLLPANFQGEKSVNAFGGSFYSYVRDMAISLNAMVETDPTNPQVGILSRHLSQQLKREKYLSTQQLSFSLIALGKIARRTTDSNAKGIVYSDGKAIANFTNGDLVIKKNQLGTSLSINSTGGDLYYFYQAEGLSASGKVLEEDNFLKVRRTYYTRNGAPCDNNNFKQNDLIVVKISLETSDGSSVDNVVITDILPAGFEVENPRLTELADMPWVKDQSVPEHLDVRDDRVNMFTTATGKRKDFYYSVRAVSKGKFVLGPICADAMYNGEYHSYSGSGVVRVR